MIPWKKINTIFLFALLSISYTFAQRVTISADKDSVLIGDHILLSIEATLPEETEVFFPIFGDTLGLFDVVEMLPLDTVEGKITQDIIITQFEAGHYQLNYIPALFITEKTKVDTLYSTNPIDIYVNTIPVDTAAAIKPIKPEREVPYTLKEFKTEIIIALCVLAAIILAILAFIFYQKRKKQPAPPPKTMLEYHEEALKKLAILDKKQLWQKEQTKEYYQAISEILRTYLEGRFSIQAMESTTEEIMQDVYFSESLKNKLGEILLQADLAKFAKFTPTGEENTRMMKLATDFVAHTKPKVVKKEDELVQ